jgi:hypothetical protein
MSFAAFPRRAGPAGLWRPGLAQALLAPPARSPRRASAIPSMPISCARRSQGPHPLSGRPVAGWRQLHRPPGRRHPALAADLHLAASFQRTKPVLSINPRCRWCPSRKSLEDDQQQSAARPGPVARDPRLGGARAPFETRSVLGRGPVRQCGRPAGAGAGGPYLAEDRGRCPDDPPRIAPAGLCLRTCRCWTPRCCRMARASSPMCRWRAWTTPCGFTARSAPTSGCSMPRTVLRLGRARLQSRRDLSARRQCWSRRWRKRG